VSHLDVSVTLFRLEHCSASCSLCGLGQVNFNTLCLGFFSWEMGITVVLAHKVVSNE
jgi:hypothetical protein